MENKGREEKKGRENERGKGEGRKEMRREEKKRAHAILVSWYPHQYQHYTVLHVVEKFLLKREDLVLV